MAAAHLLLVDNIADHLFVARSLFEARGYKVTTATTAEKALNLLYSPAADQFDVIVSDINMPQKDGFDFIRELKKDPRLAKIPFVFVTASYWTNKVREDGLALGADKFIFRPFNLLVLLHEIEEIIPEEKRAHNPLPDEQ